MALRDFFTFRRMLTPMIIQFLFWIGIVATTLSGIMGMFTPGSFFHGLQTLIFGPIIIRLACELIILFFRMNETLTDIKNQNIK